MANKWSSNGCRWVCSALKVRCTRFCLERLIRHVIKHLFYTLVPLERVEGTFGQNNVGSCEEKASPSSDDNDV